MSGVFLSILQFWAEIPIMLGYIRGQSFKRPLSKKEEEQCLARLFAGDETAKDELIEHNMRLVAHVVKKFQPKHDVLDDYISIGAIGLMKAINTYTPDRKTKLSTYAARCIENEIVKSIGCVGGISLSFHYQYRYIAISNNTIKQKPRKLPQNESSKNFILPVTNYVIKPTSKSEINKNHFGGGEPYGG